MEAPGSIDLYCQYINSDVIITEARMVDKPVWLFYPFLFILLSFVLVCLNFFRVVDGAYVPLAIFMACVCICIPILCHLRYIKPQCNWCTCNIEKYNHKFGTKEKIVQGEKRLRSHQGKAGQRLTYTHSLQLGRQNEDWKAASDTPIDFQIKAGQPGAS